jgi:hypothetical protein
VSARQTYFTTRPSAVNEAIRGRQTVKLPLDKALHGVLCCPRLEEFEFALAIEDRDARTMERSMMFADRNKLLPEKIGGAFARRGRLAPCTGWIGGGYRIRILAAPFADVHGSSVPNGRRLRT